MFKKSHIFKILSKPIACSENNNTLMILKADWAGFACLKSSSGNFSGLRIILIANNETLFFWILKNALSLTCWYLNKCTLQLLDKLKIFKYFETSLDGCDRMFLLYSSPDCSIFRDDFFWVCSRMFLLIGFFASPT